MGVVKGGPVPIVIYTYNKRYPSTREREREMYRTIETEERVSRENVVEYNTVRQLTAF